MTTFCDFKDMIRIQRFFFLNLELATPFVHHLSSSAHKNDFPTFERVHKEWLVLTDIVKGNKASEDGQSKALHLT